jgi:hypothetical protein
VQPVLIELLREPALTPELTLAQWDAAVRQARSAGMLARLATWLELFGAIDEVPVAVRRHMYWSGTLAEACHREIRDEARDLRDLLSAVPGPVVLLKGSAYVLHYREAAAGRFFEDIDLLVPEAHLGAVESRLLTSGWIWTHLNHYDQRYYRQWMHELPPLQHMHRGTTVDVHFNILPIQGRVRVPAEKLFEQARPLSDLPGMQVLCEEDLVLHSAVHMLHNEAWDSALRDLTDLALLLRAREVDASFPDRLAARADELGLARQLAVAAMLLRAVLGYEGAVDCGRRRLSALEGLMVRAVEPAHPSCATYVASMARWLLFLRGHWLKLPYPLLARHLLHKAVDGLRVAQPTT